MGLCLYAKKLTNFTKLGRTTFKVSWPIKKNPFFKVCIGDVGISFKYLSCLIDDYLWQKNAKLD